MKRTKLRQLVVARRDLAADIADARLKLLAAEQAGHAAAAELHQHVKALEDRERELDYAQRALRAEIAAVEARAEPEMLNPMMAG